MLSKRNVNKIFLGIFLTEIILYIGFNLWFTWFTDEAYDEITDYFVVCNWASVSMIIISGFCAVCCPFHY